MSAINDKKHHYKTISKTCYTANIVYLILHAFYLVLFIVAKLYILMFITIGVIALYLFFFFLIYKKKYYLYALLCGNEFFAFIAVTTIMLGFNTGFHFYLIALCIVSFFTSYFSKNKNVKNSIIWVALSLVIYLTLYLVTSYVAPYYHIDKWLEMTLFITHAVVVFAFIASYLLVFMKYALSLEKKIMIQSRTDELTQIGNRYALFDYFEGESKNNKVIALFDIDDFKNINDQYGHVTGDFILKRVAELSTEILKDSFVCRYGGEEFVVVINDNDFETVFVKLENLRNSIEKEVFKFDNHEIKITITIGARAYEDNFSLEKWVELADEKMYFGKNNGKNRTVF